MWVLGFVYQVICFGYARMWVIDFYLSFLGLFEFVCILCWVFALLEINSYLSKKKKNLEGLGH